MLGSCLLVITSHWWVRELRYCATVAGGTMFFFNQMGRAHPKAGGRELDRRTWDEMPARRALEAA
jgi:protein gp37